MRDIYFLLLDHRSLAEVDLIDMTASGNIGEYYITRIIVPERYRGQGYASAMFQRVLDDADRENVTLVLNVVPDGGLDHNQLCSWYRRCGFKMTSPNTYYRKPNHERIFRKDLQNVPLTRAGAVGTHQIP